MFRCNLARALVLAALTTLAACGGGGGTASAPSTTAAAPPTTAATTGSPSTTIPAPPTTEAVRVIEVTYAGGQVVGGAQRTAVRLGEKVRLRVTSDVAEEVHVHTYDVRADVAAGQTAQVELVASIPGRHEVELEKKHKLLLTLEVR